MIGGRYTMTVSREGKNTWIHGERRYTSEHVDERTRREMEALDIAALAALGREDPGTPRLPPESPRRCTPTLVDLAAKLKFGHERDALLAYVIRRITNPW
jgi:hypothetical protein